MNKLLIGIVILAVILGVAGFFISGVKQMSGTEETSQAGDDAMAASGSAHSITWAYADAGEQQGIPYTSVSVSVDGKSYDAGTFAGSCAGIGASGGIDGNGLLAGELAGTQCYYAGGGSEVGVFANEDGGYDIMVGDLDEGSAETSPVRGNFRVILSIP